MNNSEQGISLKQFIDEYSHGSYEFGDSTCRGVVSTLSKDQWDSGKRYYESNFFKQAMKTMEELSQKEFLENSAVEIDDCMQNYTNLLDKDDELWKEVSPDNLQSKFEWGRLRTEVMLYETQLRTNPSKFVKFFQSVMCKFCAERRGDEKAVAGWEKEIKSYFA